MLGLSRWRRAVLGLILLLPLLLACGILGDAPTPTRTSGPAAETRLVTGLVPTPLTTRRNAPATETGSPTATGAASQTPAGIIASPELQSAPSTTPSPVSAEAVEQPSSAILHDLAIEPGDILLLPVPAIYAGDLVTFHIAPNLPRELAPNDVQVRVLLDGEELLVGNVDYRKLSGDVVGLYQWAWDTTDQEGTHTITIELDPHDRIRINDENPDNNRASLNVIVRPRELLPESQADAAWIEAESDCCILHLISGTAAERDVEQLKARVDAAFESAAATLTAALSPTPYDVYIIDRVIGQGGYAMDDMVVSYLDRDYVGGGLEELLVHEAVHLIDQEFAPDKVTFLSEGLAVWVAGGHYQQQDLRQRMAALLELDSYVPINDLIARFFSVQHEIGYLESASLIEYLVNTYGWPRVREFYSNTSAGDGLTVIDAVDINMRAYFGRTLEQIESDWLAYVSSLPRDFGAVEALQTTIRYYDVMRRYQTSFDPTAYYLYAWLPDPKEAAERQATADFSRRPETEVNIALETMLMSANALLWQGQYERVNALLDSVNRVLNNEGTFLDPLARSYLDIVRAAAGAGYVIQRIDLNGNQASVVAVKPGSVRNESLELTMNRDRTWSIRR
ncbi:MAG: hypothetical protein PVJ75_10275 [Chloroflexota bacterium]|jgi:hypothetical protein